jgi:DNA repair photolyase
MLFLSERRKVLHIEAPLKRTLSPMHEADGKKITSGTRKWADHNVNLIDGCAHDCKYCYAKKMAIRFGRKTEATWKDMRVRQHDVDKGYRKKVGRVMFPTSHDIVPAEPCFSACMTVLEKLLKSGNDVLVTTKPHLEVVKHICDTFTKYKGQIQFRFTITSMDDEKLAEWEAGAPKFQERYDSLKCAFDARYRTSISIEPCLEPDPRNLVETLRPFVTESIWLGSMNYSGDHAFNSKETLVKWMGWFGGASLVRFKDSVEKKLCSI